MNPEEEFISEEDLATFEGWSRYQLRDPAAMAPAELESWHKTFEDVRKRGASTPKVGLMKLKKLLPGEFRYAVAFRDSSNLWLTLWIRRSPTPEFFIFIPRGDKDWDVHTSYHLDGRLHHKSYGRKALPTQKRQPLTGDFRGTESLGIFGGHGPKSVGAVCDPNDFSGVVEVGPGVLGPKQGVVIIDLVEPGHDPVDQPGTKIVTRQIFRDTVPWIVITVGDQG